MWNIKSRFNWKICLGLLVAASFTACSQNTPAALGSSNTASTGTNLASGSTSSGLFDTSVNANEATTGNTALNPVGTTEASCLQNNSSLTSSNNVTGTPTYTNNLTGNTASYNASTGVYTDNVTGQTVASTNISGSASVTLCASSGADPNAVLGASIQSIQSMDQCLQIVLAAAPATDDPQTDQIAFLRAKMALVRCYRQLLTEQQNYLPWNANTNSAYGYNQSNLYQMLVDFGNGTY